MNYKSHFPIFTHHPNLVYLDSASTTQKPGVVIAAQSQFLEQSYANIHRGTYQLSQASDAAYARSKQLLAHYIHASSAAEVIFTANATSASNLLVGSLITSGWIQKGDEIILSIQEHHASVVPWHIAAKQIGCILRFWSHNEEFTLQQDTLNGLLNHRTKAIVCTHTSNVSGGIQDLHQYKIPEGILKIQDVSQSLAHLPIHAEYYDFVYGTGHKVYADTGIGFLWGKMQHLKKLTPAIGGGGAINWVGMDDFEFGGIPQRFEPGTPHISGAISFGAAIEWIESIGGVSLLRKHEMLCIEHALKWCKKLPKNITLLGGINKDTRIGVFSFIPRFGHINDIAEYLAARNICIRAGHHCAQPLIQQLGEHGSLRMSIGIYTTLEDIDSFFFHLFELAQKPELLLTTLH